MSPAESSLYTANSLADIIVLAGWCAIAFALHAFIALSIYCSGFLLQSDNRPLIDPDDAMEVAMVVLPKSPTEMVHRATKAPVPQGDRVNAPPPDTPPPLHSSDLEFNTPDAQDKQGSESRQAERERLIKMAKLLEEIDAPSGPVDQMQSDPNSTSDESINAGAAGLTADPELARYVAKIRALFKQHFNPLPTIAAANPNIECTIHVGFDMASGKITSIRVAHNSGNPSYDGAATRAIEAVPVVPLPPDRFRKHFSNGYLMVFP